MRRKKAAFPFLPLILIVLLMAVPSAALAAMEMVLALDGIQGESMIQGHEDEVDVQGFNWSIEMPTSSYTGGGTGSARPNFSDFCVNKPLDKASVPLREKAATGGHINDARFAVIRPVGDERLEFWAIEFQNLIVTRIDFSLNSASENQNENVCFSYERIKWIYKEASIHGGSGGTIEFAWDLVQNQPR